MTHDLNTHEGRGVADTEIAGLLRAGRLTDAEAVLADLLRQHPGPIATACLSVPADGVTISGWDEVNADLVAISRRGEHVVTAVGLDLSGYGDSETDDWWDKDDGPQKWEAAWAIPLKAEDNPDPLQSDPWRQHVDKSQPGCRKKISHYRFH